MQVAGEGGPEDEDGQNDGQDGLGREIDPEVRGGTKYIRTAPSDVSVDEEAVEEARDEDEAGVGKADAGG